jgi:hypothetical protein
MDVMNTAVITVGPDTSVQAVAKLLCERGVSGVPVVDAADRLVGMSARVACCIASKPGRNDRPSNADISLLEGNGLRQIVAVLQDPMLQGDNLTYTVKVLQGDMPAEGTDVSVFIDIIGMPLTPLSYAGVARRSYRRAVDARVISSVGRRLVRLAP